MEEEEQVLGGGGVSQSCFGGLHGPFRTEINVQGLVLGVLPYLPGGPWGYGDTWHDIAARDGAYEDATGLACDRNHVLWPDQDAHDEQKTKEPR